MTSLFYVIHLVLVPEVVSVLQLEYSSDRVVHAPLLLSTLTLKQGLSVAKPDQTSDVEGGQSVRHTPRMSGHEPIRFDQDRE